MFLCLVVSPSSQRFLCGVGSRGGKVVRPDQLSMKLLSAVVTLGICMLSRTAALEKMDVMGYWTLSSPRVFQPRAAGSLCGRRGLFGLPIEDLDGDREYFIRVYRPLRWASCPAPKPSSPLIQMYGLMYEYLARRLC